MSMMENRVRWGGRAPPPYPDRADFSIMMECTPEIGHCHSVCTIYVLCGQDCARSAGGRKVKDLTGQSKTVQECAALVSTDST